MKMLFALLTVLTFTIAPAKAAERLVTEAEQAKLVPAVTAQGCTGGKMQWDEDDREFEVDDVRCSDGRTYDLKFNADFTFKSKKPEN